jgi:O-antigen ligase
MLAFANLFIMSQNQAIQTLIMIMLGGLLCIIIFLKPPLGLAMVIMSTPLVDLLPGIPILTSAVPLLGLVTVVAYLRNNNYNRQIKWKLTSVELIILLFVFWVVFSNPAASILGERRNWALTFVQLLVLFFIAKHFVKSKSDHHTIMIFFALGILVSAFVAVFATGSNYNELQRAVGLSGGANTATRYFIYGLVLLFYLQDHYSNKWIVRLFFVAGTLILLWGIILTGSRSGIILLFFVALIQVFQAFTGRNRSILIILVLGLALFWFTNFAEGTVMEPEAIVTSIVERTDTVGSRYDTWEAGWKMFLDHPIRGVGIGRYSNYVPVYWDGTSFNMVVTPHNTFIHVLSETGIIGFSFFLFIIFVVVVNRWKNIKSGANPSSSINRTWLFLLIIILIGGFTKTDLVDKFFWFLLGIDIKGS